jgi:sortase A
LNFLRFLERGLLVFGTGCLVIYAAACSHESWSQLQARAAFERELSAKIHTEKPDSSAWSKARRLQFERVAGTPVRALGRLDVPKADLSVMLLEGTDELTLNRAVGHIEGTALPGQPGNVGIAGHRDGFFRGLEHLESGDALSVTTLEGVAHYEVAELEVVEPTAVEVLDPTAYDSLTLVTCYPFYYVGDAPQRFIVHAKQVRFNPWK